MPLPADPPADVAIVGAGAAGALFAVRLAKAGRRVVVLDAGPPWALTDLVSSQLWSRRLKWGGAPVDAAGAHRVGHNMAVGWGFGGSAIHHYAGWPRLHAADFRVASDHGRGLDWPFGYDELRPWYDRVQAEAGVSGDAKAEVWRPPGAPYPMPPMRHFAQGRVLTRGFQKLGIRVSPAPMAVTSVERDDRPACQYDGWCDAGCPIQALWNPLVRHIPQAVEAGAAFRSRSPVGRIETDMRGRATGLVYRDIAGAERLQPAARIVLAGGAVQNARLLLASASPRHAQGFGNAQGLVGRYFAAHAIANVHGLFAEPTEPHRGLSAGALMSQDSYGKARAGGPFGSLTRGIAPALKPNDLLGIAMARPDLHGPALHAFIARAARHIGLIVGIAETVPTRDNRIELTSDRDVRGMPRARMVHDAPDAEALWAHANAEGLRVMRAAGSEEAWALPTIPFAHPSGGTIMGSDPARSVTNAFGQLHEAAYVVVAGGGLFPSIGAVSPTFTIYALAERTAARMIADPGAFDA